MAWLFQMDNILVVKSNIEVAQFQSNSPQFLPLSEELWKALVKLPVVYDYAAYRWLLKRFGTHYASEGSLGGTFTAVARIDEETQRYMSEAPTSTLDLSHRTSAFDCLFLSVFLILKGWKAVLTTSATGPGAGFCSSPTLTSNAQVVNPTQNSQLVPFSFWFLNFLQTFLAFASASLSENIDLLLLNQRAGAGTTCRRWK